MNFKAIRNFIRVRKLFIQAIQIIIGTALLSIAVDLFLLPNQISAGGFSGLATITYYLLNIPMGIATIVLNIPLFIITLIKGGGKSLLNALFGTIMLSVFLSVFERFEPLTTDRLLASIYGGLIAGIGSAIIFKANASTGGTDLLANIIKMFKPEVKRGSMMIIFDAVIVLLNVIFFKEIDVGLYSAVVIYITSKVLDAFFEGVNFSRMVYIISDKHEEIAKQLGIELRRGSTSIYAKGMYKKEEKNMLLCVVSRGEIRELRRIVKLLDPNAFIVISNAREVFGEGFKEG